MAANPALWSDIERDLALARENAERLLERAQSLELARDLQQLRRFRHAFRHAYGDYSYERAAENVAVAARATAALAARLRHFAELTGLLAVDQSISPERA